MATVNEAVEAWLWGRRVGAATWDGDANCAIFRYSGDFAAGGLEVSPITMPLDGRASYSFRELQEKPYMGLPGLLSDALPDKFGNGLINEWFAQKGITEAQFSPIDRLCYIGSRAMGALEFLPATGEGLGESTRIEIGDLVEIVGRIMAAKEGFATIFERNEETVLNLLSIGTSAGGAKPKALLAVNSDKTEVRSGQVAAPEGFGQWLFKFDGVTEGRGLGESTQDGRVEFAYHLMARAAGVEMAECDLFDEGGRAHFMTRRFDRTEDGGKLHAQTLAALNHFPWERPGLVGYEQLFQTVRELNLGMPAIVQCFRRMAFNILARNHDDHSKNHAFLMDREGEWSLAPAYDLTFAYKPGGRNIGVHQMRLAGKRDDFERGDLLELGRKNDMKKPDGVLGEVEEAVSRRPEFARRAGGDNNQAGPNGALARRL